MNFDLSSLNEEQIKPVLDTEGAIMVTAGAGSGKTRLLTHRIAHLIENLGIPPYKILAITFTNKAANEMKERIEKMNTVSEGLWVSTFHSMCVRILRQFIDRIGYTKNFSIYGEAEKEHAVKRLMKELPETDEDLYKRIMHSISDAKNNGLSPENYGILHKYEPEIDTVCDIYAKYQADIKRNNALDYDDLLNKTYELLVTDSEAREYYQNKFMYIHVDEFQDTNSIQYLLVKILGAKYRNVFIVGDEDQCIYGWRGANIKNIFDFEKDFKCKKYKLEQNYRSSKKILDLANKLIVNNTSRVEKTLWTENDDGCKIEYFAGGNEGFEAEYVISAILNLVKYENYKYSDFAILMRLNALTRPFEERLMQYGVPHKIFGGFKFYERKEIKDLLAYLSILSNHLDNEAILRVINFPKRGIGDVAIRQMFEYSSMHNQTLFDTIVNIDKSDLPQALRNKVEPFAALIRSLIMIKDNVRLDDLVIRLIQLLGVEQLYSGRNEEDNNRLLNIEDFVSSVKQFVDANEGLDLDDYLQMITLYTDLDAMDSSEYVKLATVHSAKGLEFKVVFVVGLEDGIFPMKRAMDSLYEMEEERRLMYVAITRAKERLYISRAKSRFLYGQRRDTIASRFLKELDFEVAKPKYAYGGEGGEGYTSVATKSTNTFTFKPASNDTSKQKVDFSKFRVGGHVKHRKFGEGVILNIGENVNNVSAEIEFKTVGKLTLMLGFAPIEPID